MISAIQNGVLGMQRATEMVNNAASDIANAATPPKPDAAPDVDIPRDAVNMIIGHRTYDANAKVIEVAARLVDEIV